MKHEIDVEILHMFSTCTKCFIAYATFHGVIFNTGTRSSCVKQQNMQNNE